jgi:hypothetical protein
MIKETKNYEMFKIHSSNRKINPMNLKKIISSIQAKNMLEYRPLLIDAKNYIIDGQHRLEAAKSLGLSVFYQVEENAQTEDMFLLNANMRKWYPEDYLHYYCGEGNPDYIQFREFMKKNSLSISVALRLLLKFSKKQDNRALSEFNSGNFKFVDPAKKHEAEEVLTKSQEVVRYLAIKLPVPHSWFTSGKFMTALMDFFIIYPVDFDEFMKKLPYKMDIMHPCGKREQYVRLFVEIYNYKNRDKLVLEE